MKSIELNAYEKNHLLQALKLVVQKNDNLPSLIHHSWMKFILFIQFSTHPSSHHRT
jgi:hypothetical protein